MSPGGYVTNSLISWAAKKQDRNQGRKDKTDVEVASASPQLPALSSKSPITSLSLLALRLPWIPPLLSFHHLVTPQTDLVCPQGARFRIQIIHLLN